MLKVAWSKEYEIVPSVDEQHKQVFALIASLTTAIETQSKEQVLEWLQYLLEYSEGHMLFEEALMLQTKYPEMECHTKSHKRILDNLQKQYQKISDGDKEPEELLATLDNWGRVHILLEDMAFKEHFLSNKIR